MESFASLLPTGPPPSVFTTAHPFVKERVDLGLVAAEVCAALREVAAFEGKDGQVTLANAADAEAFAVLLPYYLKCDQVLLVSPNKTTCESAADRHFGSWGKCEALVRRLMPYEGPNERIVPPYGVVRTSNDACSNFMAPLLIVNGNRRVTLPEFRPSKLAIVELAHAYSSATRGGIARHFGAELTVFVSGRALDRTPIY